MKIELSYQYCDLDKQQQFGIVPESHQVYINWIWFYMGVLLREYPAVMLYPFRVGKVIKKYKYANDAERQAKYIVYQIKKKLNDQNK